MKWRGRRGSGNIEDRRGRGSMGSRGSGSGRRRAAPIGGVGLIAVLVIGYFLGIDVTPLLDAGGQGGTGPVTGNATITAEDRRAAEFVSVTLADTEEVWDAVFADQIGRAYAPATLVLFKGATGSACGGASEATGPFYCPADRKVYLDTDFFTTLERRLGAGGDFAAAYVVAHEIGHHVQNELGVLGKANTLRARVGEAEANEISVRIELQADCLSGVWAHHAAARLGTIERGDIAEAMNAAEKIGDDTLSRNAGRRPMPDSFTHGSAAQRQRWFAAGLDAGQVAACDTFSAPAL
ncbi:MAG: hypothetical protein CVT84_18480 [Alphaproteobacteria bacterium HGW-Alphaproteobacteria-6]|nr:MAG: hypothetical protein CVT84_18480 [Alphaproteobacteria bacterium HGW-Alphaproteobacteria-6]